MIRPVSRALLGKRRRPLPSHTSTSSMATDPATAHPSTVSAGAAPTDSAAGRTIARRATVRYPLGERK